MSQQQTLTAVPGNEACELNFDVVGMDCASCVAHVEKAARAVPGVRDVSVNLARGRARVTADTTASPERIAAAITDAGYPAAPEQPSVAAGNVEAERLERQAHEARAWFRRAMVGIVLWLPLESLHWILYFTTTAHDHGHFAWMDWVSLAASTVGIIYIGRGFYQGAWKALRRGTTNMDVLIAMGATVAYLYSLVAFFGYQVGWWREMPHLYFMESTGLLALISLGHWLEARARQSAGSAIHELLELAPATAIRLEDAGHHEVHVAELKIGDRVLVRPGDRVPIDSLVVEGRSSVDESMITGEPLPVPRAAGDRLIGGTQNQDGRLIARVTATGGQTALAQIVKLVETAQSSKPPVQRLADRISAVFVPAVLLIGLITAIGWFAYGQANDWTDAAIWGMIAKAVCSVLLIACPCALGLAVPAALMVGTGRGAKRGILIRDIDALQHAEVIDTIVLDKTGTITRGKPVVAEVIPLNGLSSEQVLQFAAAAEQYSEHPLAKAIVTSARERAIPIPDLDGFDNEPGYGVVATIGGQTMLVGNEALLLKHGSTTDGQQFAAGNGRTRVHVARKNADGSITRLGDIAVTDEIKPDSAAAIAELHRLNLRTILLSGDHHEAAAAIAEAVGIDDVRADVKPEGKAQVIEQLKRAGRRVAMVGDGINDAPALAAADLGIAIGSGSDVAKETGSIVLVHGSLHGVSTAIRLSRATMLTIRQNLFFAFIYNVLAIPLAAFGLLNPLIAAGAMALSDVTVLGNALLLRRTKID